MKSLVIKRSILIAGHRTSVSVEDDFWEALHKIADQRHEILSHLIASIDADRQHANLSSAIRLYVLGFYRDQYQGRAALDPSIRQSPTVSHSTISRL
jgi:predicted DNA-binding ribbon-helix-helix protein